MYSDTIEVTCPACGIETMHSIIKTNSDMLVRCKICGTVHIAAKLKDITKEKFIDIRTVISTGDSSFVRRSRVPDEILKVGMEFVAEDENTGEATPVTITSIEVEDKRVEKAKADQITTLWTRAIDRVTVKISINLGMITESVEIKTQGDREFVIGNYEKIKGWSYIIKKIAQRGGKMISRPGTSVLAKDIIRIFADPGKDYKFKNRSRRKNFHGSFHGSIIRKGKSVWSLRSRGSA